MNGEIFQPLADWFKINWEDISAMLGISAMAGACRTILSADQRNFTGMCRATFLALSSGMLVGSLIWDIHGYGLDSIRVKFGIIAAAGFLADHILLGLLSFAAFVQADPRQAIPNIISIILRRPTK